jgi:deazaflavin-dependent oxidoreductase (nitroreductase family)
MCPADRREGRAIHTVRFMDLTFAQLGQVADELRSDAGPGTVTQGFNQATIEAFRANAGRLPGEMQKVPILLLTTTGAKTGATRTVPVVYFDIDSRILVAASMGGADVNPPWLHNLKAHPDVTVELGSETFAAVAAVTSGSDRDQLWQEIIKRFPVWGRYQERTTRVIPVVELIR